MSASELKSFVICGIAVEMMVLSRAWHNTARHKAKKTAQNLSESYEEAEPGARPTFELLLAISGNHTVQYHYCENKASKGMPEQVGNRRR